MNPAIRQNNAVRVPEENMAHVLAKAATRKNIFSFFSLVVMATM